MVRLFKVSIPIVTLVLLFSECILIAGCFVLATYLFLPGDPIVWPHHPEVAAG
jgi:hypothetical protein